MIGWRIVQAASAADLAAVAGLFRTYAAGLGVDLAYQDFEAELAALPGKYAPPGGALLLARGSDTSPLGCVALRALASAGCCELKRLFVLPAARGTGLGRALMAAADAAAMRLGYAEMRLDTLPGMEEAQAIYRKRGFVPIPPYYDSPVPGTVFLARRLHGEG